MVREPHKVTRYLREQGVSSLGDVRGAAYVSPMETRCHIEPLSASRAMEAYGLELTSPVRLFWSVSEPARFPVGSLVVRDGLAYEVRTEASVFQFGHPTDHCECLAERLATVPDLRVNA